MRRFLFLFFQSLTIFFTRFLIPEVGLLAEQSPAVPEVEESSADWAFERSKLGVGMYLAHDVEADSKQRQPPSLVVQLRKHAHSE